MSALVINASDLDKAVGMLGSLSVLDRRLLKYAGQGKTPEWMSNKLGGVLSPASCAQRVREILKSEDWLSQVERRALILLDMVDLKNILMDRVKSEGGMVTDPRTGETSYAFGDPRWAQNLTKLLSEMNKLISSEQAKVTDERSALRRAHAGVMIQAIELAFKTMVLKIQESYPDVDELVLRGFLEDALPNAVSAIEMSVDVDEREDGF